MYAKSLRECDSCNENPLNGLNENGTHALFIVFSTVCDSMITFFPHTNQSYSTIQVPNILAFHRTLWRIACVSTRFLQHQSVDSLQSISWSEMPVNCVRMTLSILSTAYSIELILRTTCTKFKTQSLPTKRHSQTKTKVS